MGARGAADVRGIPELGPAERARREQLELELGSMAKLVRRTLVFEGRAFGEPGFEEPRCEHAIELLSIDDVDPLLVELEELERSDPAAAIERLPYWASLWSSSVALARVLLARDGPAVAGLSVLELGCGAGLAGIAARLAGARVLSTDHLEPALRLSELNFLVNGLDGFRGRLLDWRSPPGDLAADLVLAADVAYERETFAAFAETLERVTSPTGRVLLAEPGRSVARGLLALLAARGWRNEPTQVPAPLDGRETQVHIHALTR